MFRRLWSHPANWSISMEVFLSRFLRAGLMASFRIGKTISNALQAPPMVRPPLPPLFQHLKKTHKMLISFNAGKDSSAPMILVHPFLQSLSSGKSSVALK